VLRLLAVFRASSKPRTPDKQGGPADVGNPHQPAGSAKRTRSAGAPAARRPKRRPGHPPAPPPAPSRKAPGRDPVWARLAIVFGAVLVLASGGVIGTEKVLADRYENSVKRDTLIADDARAEPARAPSRIVGPLNFLLLGSDARPLENADGTRADTIIVAHIPASLDKVYLLSIPRDLRVEIPPYPLNGFEGSREKINAAYQHAGGGGDGVQLLSMTLSNLLNIRFDGAALVDFTGFQNVVKALGGVDMCVDHRVVSEHIGFDSEGKYLHPHDGGTPVVYEVGCRQFNGWQALDYVRQRYSLPDGDYGRQRHQQQFLQALLRKARAQGFATNPIKLDRLIRAVAGTLTVDTGGMSLESLVFGLRDIGTDDIVGVTVPSESAWVGNTSYIVPFEEEATALYQALADDTLEAWVDANPQWVNRL
jgi:LCP family protein required for cell wall assembly